MNYIQVDCPGCLYTFSKNQKDPNNYCDACTAESFENGTQTKDMKKKCMEHRWVWSGIPKGSAWCGNCDVDYDEKIHGPIKDLSGTPKACY